MSQKTNAIRIISQAKLPFTEYEYDQFTNGLEIAQTLHENLHQVFKTLVTTSKSKKYYVFMIPVDKELDVKKAAQITNEKSIEMVKSKELLPLTGYVHGGCSPIGMKKFFPTFIDASALAFSEIFFSGGRIGLQVKMSLPDLKKIIKIEVASLTKENSTNQA